MSIPIPEIQVVFDHPEFIVINKPTGISVHREPHLDESQQMPSILEIVQQQLSIPNLWLVHRLDKVTSGLLILAKTEQAASALSQKFAQREIQKYYLAVSDKKPKKKQGSIIGDMEKSRNGLWKLCHSKQSPAITRFFSKGLGGTRLFILKLETGKTHQIRVALKSIGSPILGDVAYAGSPSDRTYLHAYMLAFNYQDEDISIIQAPTQGEHFLTPEFETQLSDYAQPQELNWP
ncbi:TIGR01621 family pseudouridine synthase [Paraneptunicella aestuarii]|uniref:TIGR01621 family pseudouridine synthase n=1 Tax=Paraneptunicella aestuarii TaxID=2831148 RepID=UPI001E4E0AC0|nr:TIGR01621 family pseudouridine synthase [Paraneptunicella aestuarii]UAA37528.1 TIGR01621 family pseudouridine synthase [Paraneptunicella aestuarii]